MKKFMLPVLALSLCALSIQAVPVWADEDAIEKEETAATKTKDRPEWNENLKTTYALTDEQITALKTRGLNYPQIAISAQLAQKSGKTIDEVVAMRLDSKMGWGKIAKELGVAPSEIGHSIRDMRHKVKDQKMMAKDERRAERLEKKAEKKADKAEKAADKAAEKAEKSEKKSH